MPVDVSISIDPLIGLNLGDCKNYEVNFAPTNPNLY